MRKLLLLLLLAAAPGRNAGAQAYLGGGLGFGTGPKGEFCVSVAPEAGYNFAGGLTLGGRLSYVSGWNRSSIDPYARWRFLKEENVIRILATVHAPFTFASDYFSYGVFLQPGVSVRVSDTVRLECHIGAFGWGSIRSGSVTSAGWRASVNANTVSVGAAVCL